MMGDKTFNISGIEQKGDGNVVVNEGSMNIEKTADKAVSYTHLTLPTNREV